MKIEQKILEIIKANGHLNHLGTICHAMRYKHSFAIVEKHLKKMVVEGKIERVSYGDYEEIRAI